MDARTLAKEARLSQARLKQLLHYDPKTGVFTHARDAGRWGRIKAGTVVGTAIKGGRVVMFVGTDLFQASRLAWLYMKGVWPTGEVDHEDGFPGHNWWTNLRDATHAQNQQNLKKRSDNASGFTGVARFRDKWQAGIGLNGKRIHLGHFDTPELAHAAYVEAKARLHTFQPTIRA